MAKKQTLQDIKAAQKKLKEMSKKESPKPRPKRKTVKEQYAELRPTTEPVVAEEVDELKLKNQLFGEELVGILSKL